MSPSGRDALRGLPARWPPFKPDAQWRLPASGEGTADLPEEGATRPLGDLRRGRGLCAAPGGEVGNPPTGGSGHAGDAWDLTQGPGEVWATRPLGDLKPGRAGRQAARAQAESPRSRGAPAASAGRGGPQALRRRRRTPARELAARCRCTPALARWPERGAAWCRCTREWPDGTRHGRARGRTGRRCGRTSAPAPVALRRGARPRWPCAKSAAGVSRWCRLGNLQGGSGPVVARWWRRSRWPQVLCPPGWPGLSLRPGASGREEPEEEGQATGRGP